MGGFGLSTDDCRGDHERLEELGVEFTQPPSDRPYGVEAVLRDNSGNWIVLIEPTPYPGADVPHAGGSRRPSTCHPIATTSTPCVAFSTLFVTVAVDL